MRKSRLEEVSKFIGFSSNGCTWKELIHEFPRNTLNRHLQTMIAKGDIERIEEERNGRRGRRSPTIYRSLKPLCMEVPVQILKGKETVEVTIQNLSNSQTLSKECIQSFQEMWPIAKYHRRKNKPPIVWLSPDDAKERNEKIIELRSKGKKIKKVSNRFFDI